MGALLLALCGDSLHSVFVFHPVAALRGRKPPREAAVNNQKEENPMKKTRTVRTFLAGVLVTLLVVGMIPPALAAAGKTVTIWPGINVYIDDQKLDAKDVNGKPVEIFTYNGTTYLPVRAIAEALGKNVQWDGKTQSVYLGQHGTSQPSIWLTKMDHFAGSSWLSTADTDQDNTGATHYNCFVDSFDRTYLLNGQYSRLSGVLYQRHNWRSSSTYGRAYLEIYGDDNLLYSKAFESGTTGIMPIPFDLDVSGVLRLQVKLNSCPSGNKTFDDLLGLGDVGLWK